MTFVTDQMEQGLRELQTVTPHDYEAAFYAALSGSWALRPTKCESHAEWLEGRLLALQLWIRRMATTNDLRSAGMIQAGCTCGGRGACLACALAAFDDPDGATLMQCCSCERFWVWSRGSRGYCPHCGSGDTGRAVGDARPERADIIAAFAKQVA